MDCLLTLGKKVFTFADGGGNDAVIVFPHFPACGEVATCLAREASMFADVCNAFIFN